MRGTGAQFCRVCGRAIDAKRLRHRAITCSPLCGERHYRLRNHASPGDGTYTTNVNVKARQVKCPQCREFRRWELDWLGRVSEVCRCGRFAQRGEAG